MRAYIVILNGKKIIVKAQCWMQAFKLSMIGRSQVPRSLIIKPIKRKRCTAFDQALPNLLKHQAH